MKFACFLLTTLIIFPLSLFSQAKTRKLSTIINHPSVNAYAPLISADADVLLFVSDNAEDNILTPFFSIKENNDWIEPIVLPKNIHTRLSFLYGFGLSADGRKLYVSTQKMPSVGGYDIWTSELKGKSWSEPQNLGAPINSRLHEACASLTTDGNTMYFMRCEKMEQSKAENCKIFRVKKKPTGQWDVPEELPASINTGNSQTPRIMADGETLIFSSNKMTGGKGGMDLYLSRFTNNTWSNPVPLDFVNTDKDDQYVSAAGLGRYLLKDVAGARKNEIMEYLIPNELRPKGMMKLEGTVLDAAGKPVPSYISVLNTTNNQRVYSGRPNADGSFLLYLMEASKYEVSVEPEKSDLSFQSREFDLMSDKIPQSSRLNVVLKPLAAGDEVALDLVKFKPGSSELLPASYAELQRLARVAKNNPALKLEIQVMLSGYREDSAASDPDLTEVTVDSVATRYDEIDSLGQLYKKDTIMVRRTYHNDRTGKQAASIVSYLSSQGVDPKNLTVFVNAIPAAVPENRKTVVKARAR
jgi:outer membrane protein OmpA-like peptidoglycan-associated protein